MEWVRLAEAAELENENYTTIRMRINDNVYITKTEPNPEGGRALVYVAVESLSAAAQQKYKRRQRETARREQLRRALSEECEPWYYGIDCAWYIENYRTEFLKKSAIDVI